MLSRLMSCPQRAFSNLEGGIPSGAEDERIVSCLMAAMFLV